MKVFIECLSFNNWYDTTYEDYYYSSKTDQQNGQVSLLTVPFWVMPFELIDYLCSWFKIPTTIYKWKPYPFASYIQWLSKMESIFLYVI